MSKIQSGSLIDKDSVYLESVGVMDVLNGALTGESLQRSSFGPDQLSDGALFSAETTSDVTEHFIHKHITYPETAPGPHWYDDIHWHPSSVPPVPISQPTLEGVRHYNERKFWQRMVGHDMEMSSCRNDGHGFTIFFNYDCRVKGTWEENPDPDWDFLTKNALAGRRGWISVVFKFQMSHKSPVLYFSPMTALGCFALEYNTAAGIDSKFIDIEQVFTFHETFFISRATLQRLAFFNGYSPASAFEMGNDADFSNAKFGWQVHAGIDRWDSYYDKAVGLDAPAFGSNSHANKNGQIFSVKNGSGGFMCFDYFPESTEEATGWLR